MKQVYSVMMIVAFFLTIGISQSVKAQEVIWPSFPGGDDAMESWLSQNLKYPEVGKENGIQGVVKVSFYVEEDGSITDVEIKQGINEELDKEAIRLVYSINWVPGRIDGRVMRLRKSISVNFDLKKEKQRTPYEKVDQRNASQKSFNPVGRWIHKNDNNRVYEYKTDHTFISYNYNNSSETVKGTDITFPVVSRTWRGTWNIEGNVITEKTTQLELSIGDISYYPANDQQRIKDYSRSFDNYFKPDSNKYIIKSISPISMIYAIYNKNMHRVDEYVFNRDVTSLTAQEKAEYDKEVERLNQIEKEKELKAKQAAKERDDRVMARLKAKAIASGNQRDYWIIGHTYEYGEGDDFLKITPNLDSALVWYKKAAAIDAINERYVTAVSHKIKTGNDYYEDSKKQAYVEFRNKASKLGQKYGVAYVNSLLNTGNIKVGTPLALLQEYITLFNPYVINNAKGYLKYYEPTARDLMQYGKTAKRVKIVDHWDNVVYSFMVANGKVVTVYQQDAVLKMK